MIPEKWTKHHDTAFYLLLLLFFTNCLLYPLAEEDKLLWYPVLQTSGYQPLCHHTVTSSEGLRERGWIRARHYMCPRSQSVISAIYDYVSPTRMSCTLNTVLRVSQPQHCPDWFRYTYTFLFTINKVVCNLRIWAKVTLALLLTFTCPQIPLPLNNILLFL